MWTDCQEAKEFLSQKNIPYKEINVQGEPGKEKELKEMTGTIIVPAFIFTNTKFMVFKQKKILIGFENNRSEIEKLVENVKEWKPSSWWLFCFRSEERRVGK